MILLQCETPKCCTLKFVDVDECSTQRSLCISGECVNTEGSFYCVCREGSELTPDGTQCQGKFCNS